MGFVNVHSGAGVGMRLGNISRPPQTGRRRDTPPPARSIMPLQAFF